MAIKRAFFSISLICVVGIVQALEPPLLLQVAVIDFASKGVEESAGPVVADLLRDALVKTRAFRVLDRTNMNTILHEQGFSNTGCTDASCALEIGRLLSAQKVIAGSVSKLGSSYLITATVTDAVTGEVESSQRQRANSLDAFIDNVDELAMRIVHPEMPVKASADIAGSEPSSVHGSSSFPVGLIAWYPLHGNADDASENGFNGVFPGGNLNPRSAKGPGDSAGTALEFDGETNSDDGDYVEVNNSAALEAIKSSASISVSCMAYSADWKKVQTAGSGQAQDRSLVSTAEGGGFAIYCTANNRIAFGVYVDGRYREPGIAGAGLSAGWHHLLGTYDASSGKTCLYVDGSRASTIAGTAKPIDCSRYPNATLVIGADAEEGGGPESMQGGNTHFKGRLSDVRIWNRALSDGEVAGLAEKP